MQSSSTVTKEILFCLFCFSGDGMIKIWDRDKTLLREIMMNETLTVAAFLNTQGTIVGTINNKETCF